MQLNSLNVATLLDAKAHPEKHKNLIVRVWGWSGYFCELAPEYQDHIIERHSYWEFHVSPWHAPQDVIGQLTHGVKLGADMTYPGAKDLFGQLARLRARLTPEEVERFRRLSRLCARAMDGAIRVVRPGQTEYDIAANLDLETQRLGVQPIVNLIATDERIFKFRHPLPTGKKLERYAMLVLCGRQAGLVCSVFVLTVPPGGHIISLHPDTMI